MHHSATAAVGLHGVNVDITDSASSRVPVPVRPKGLPSGSVNAVPLPLYVFLLMVRCRLFYPLFWFSVHQTSIIFWRMTRECLL